MSTEDKFKKVKESEIIYAILRKANGGGFSTEIRAFTEFDQEAIEGMSSYGFTVSQDKSVPSSIIMYNIGWCDGVEDFEPLVSMVLSMSICAIVNRYVFLLDHGKDVERMSRRLPAIVKSALMEYAHKDNVNDVFYEKSIRKISVSDLYGIICDYC